MRDLSFRTQDKAQTDSYMIGLPADFLLRGETLHQP